MSYFSISGLMGFFDLRNLIADESLQYDAILVDKERLNHDIALTFYNNFYYFIDFSTAQIGRPPLAIDDPTQIRQAKNSIAIHIQKEVINAFNCCLYIIHRRLMSKKVTYSNALKRIKIANDVDQFFIPNTAEKVTLPFKDYINNCSFSSAVYKLACQAVYNKSKPGVSDITVVNEAIKMYNSLLNEQKQPIDYNQYFFYILSYLWKAVYFKNHDLRVEAAILSRSVFELLVRKHQNIKPEKDLERRHYEDYLDTGEDSEFCDNFSRNTRNTAVHELKVSNNITGIEEHIKKVVHYFERDARISISEITT